MIGNELTFPPIPSRATPRTVSATARHAEIALRGATTSEILRVSRHDNNVEEIAPRSCRAIRSPPHMYRAGLLRGMGRAPPKN